MDKTNAFWMAMVASLAWGSSSFFEKMGLNGADPRAGVLARSLGVLVGSLVFAALAPAVTTQFLQMAWKPRLLLMGGGVLASVLGQIFFYRALKVGDVGRVAAVGGSWPLFAFAFSVLLLGEPVTMKKLGGVAFVALGVALLK
jgi:transporter family protein